MKVAWFKKRKCQYLFLVLAPPPFPVKNFTKKSIKNQYLNESHYFDCHLQRNRYQVVEKNNESQQVIAEIGSWYICVD